MSTRCVISFKDGAEVFHVYQHMDGYPTEVARGLKAALKYAWELPRFEPDDFAAAFIAANKGEGGGNIRMGYPPKVYGDLSYRYSVTHNAGKLRVEVRNGLTGRVIANNLLLDELEILE